MTLEVRIGQHSLAGPGKTNQDFHGAVLARGAQLASKGIVVALADGIGSSRVSHVASATAVRGFLDDYYATSDAWPVRRAAQCVLQATNAWLHAQTQRGAGRRDRDLGCICTFSALVLKGREAHLLHVGDARVYRLHPQSLEQLSEDHRVRADHGGTYLGRALGVDRSVDIDYLAWPLEAGETYLLATDGAYEYLDAGAVQAALAANADDLDAVAAALARAARASGSDDDATVQIVRVDALPPPASHALQHAREGLVVSPPLRPGERFEGYTIVRELHVSPRSHVHLALEDASGRHVAIKTPSIEAADDPSMLDRFMLEEWVARRVDNPHVLKAARDDAPRRHLFVAMEYVDGQTLAQWMIDHPAPGLDAVRGLVAQAARGLQALHRQEMVHLDVRPANLMLDASGTVRLIDFGATWVAGLAERDAEPAPQGPAGELQYAAPEALLGRAVDARADLFSLAVVTYQLLTGALPYGLDLARTGSEADLSRLRYVPVGAHRSDLPPWLDRVLRKALQPNPSRRQQALSEFIHDLCHPGPEFTVAHRRPLLERNPAAFWRGLALLLAAVLVLVLVGIALRANA
ncbi:bifunctional protein-serine/threonine kinase/phosphatase [Piscinibacter koreensis]|uniref:Protein kinase n=1 Tax=Piscinibacter koreensis TaxID=2742824 RepID=A0A7Y6TWI6_9BURK|nr:bifunctional protein-serine/threonine kinase/phosphatase [Schlegelella koreensis]NUZ06036.1 protein kinase [Schlegelella koreensis]